MSFAADLHVHSRWSRATSSEADLAGYSRWAQVKGIALVGTGDFTHPRWLADIARSSSSATGSTRLKRPAADSPLEGARPADLPRPVHPHRRDQLDLQEARAARARCTACVGVPTLEDARRLSVKLAAIGNIASDGRPILGLDPKDLLAMLLEIGARRFLDPRPHLDAVVLAVRVPIRLRRDRGLLRGPDAARSSPSRPGFRPTRP